MTRTPRDMRFWGTVRLIFAALVAAWAVFGADDWISRALFVAMSALVVHSGYCDFRDAHHLEREQALGVDE